MLEILIFSPSDFCQIPQKVEIRDLMFSGLQKESIKYVNERKGKNKGNALILKKSHNLIVPEPFTRFKVTNGNNYTVPRDPRQLCRITSNGVFVIIIIA